ncbi:MAG: hypothetical protein CM1200mP3_13030 [Chloroflexota bacterium]|nr:MAG: hypothetical protein CM1200mP3_13030 [Chloroflexota bacterium]
MKVCGNTGWIEIMGAGMVHPEVLKGVGYDPGVIQDLHLEWEPSVFPCSNMV